MKPPGILLGLLLVLAITHCKKDDEVSERFKLLTTPTWTSDSLLVNGEDAGGPGEMLEDFKGDMKFYEDGTGYFGDYTGTWQFSPDETELTITTDSLIFPLTTRIVELSTASLKITTGFPDITTGGQLKIRMTFRAK